MKSEIVRETFYTITFALISVELIGLAYTYKDSRLLGCAGVVSPMVIASGVGLKRAFCNFNK